MSLLERCSSLTWPGPDNEFVSNPGCPGGPGGPGGPGLPLTETPGLPWRPLTPGGPAGPCKIGKLESTIAALLATYYELTPSLSQLIVHLCYLVSLECSNAAFI